jgi:LacI family transcriptional regulator
MNGSKRATMDDVARAAGVSRQTVSRAINDLGEISPETRDRVLRIAEEMGYRPSSIARGLATQRTLTLGLVVPDNVNPFFSDVTRGVEHVAYAEGYSVFLCNTDENQQQERAVLQSLEEKRVDGVILCSPRLPEEELRSIVAPHLAVVLVNRSLKSVGTGAVLIDDEAGARMVVQHLLQTGHREIGFLAGPAASHSGQQRAKGYRAALAAAELQAETGCIHHCSPTVDGGRRAARELLETQSDLSALFCYNDLVAVGALQACTDLGLCVPDELAVAGFDDIPLAALVTPPLTTCRVPRHELGVQAMRLLLDCVNGDAEASVEIVVQPELVIRASAP